MTGVNPVIFWASNLAWDGFLFLLSAALTTVILVALDEKDTFTSYGATGTLTAIIAYHMYNATIDSRNIPSNVHPSWNGSNTSSLCLQFPVVHSCSWICQTGDLKCSGR